MITLYAFVGVDPYVMNPALFRKFLRYYRDCGVQRFVFDLHSNDGDAARIGRFRTESEAFGAVVSHVVQEPFSPALHLKYQDLFVERYSGPDAWCLLTDGDEFVEFPDRDVPAFLRGCDEGGYNVVVGNLLDRFSMDEPFAEISDESSLDELFPFSYPLTRLVRRGWDRKLVAFKGRFAAINGHHALKEEFGRVVGQLETVFLNVTDKIKSSGLRRRLRRLYPRLEIPVPGIRRWPGRLKVHHIAWDSVLKRKMEARLQEKDCIFSREFRNILDFIASPDPGRRLAPHLTEKARLGI